MVAKRFYLDTSAYLCILLGEAGHEKLIREISESELVSSVIMTLETGRNLVRLSRAGILTAAEFQNCISALASDMKQFLLRDLTFDLCASITMPAVSTPRSLDLVHLRTAMWFHQQKRLTRFVTLDASQQMAARELELPV